MPHASNGKARLHWDEKGAGTPVLLVMGATYTSAMWYPVIDALAGRHRVIWFDNRGIGQSSPVTFGSIEDMAADAAAVLDAAGVDRAHVYGVSLGGVVALQLALQSPERARSLVLGCTGILSADKPRAPGVVTLLARLPSGVRKRVLGLLSRNGYGSAATAEAIAEDRAVLSAPSGSTTGVLQQQKALRAYAVQRSAVERLQLPALVLHGTEDGTVPFAFGQELAEALPRSTFVPLDGAGHNYLVGRPVQANEAVLTFLDDVDRDEAKACALRAEEPVRAQ